MAAQTLNMIKFCKAEHGKGLKFWPHMCFIFFIATSTGSNKKNLSLFFQITHQEKAKNFICNPIEFIESYVNILTSYNLPHAKIPDGHYSQEMKDP